jgi:hypothetical protein
MGYIYVENGEDNESYLLFGKSDRDRTAPREPHASPTDCVAHSAPVGRSTALLIHRQTNRVFRAVGNRRFPTYRKSEIFEGVVHFVHDDLARFWLDTRPRQRTPVQK